MSSLADRIAQFQNMTANVPDDELGHFRLGQLLAEDGRHAEALESFRRTLELAPTFSKVYQLLAETHLKLDQKDEAVRVLTEGYTVADGRGDRVPRDAMAKLLTSLGEPVPVSAPASTDDDDADDGIDTGFRCARPGCPAGKRAVPLPRAPIADAIGERIRREICTVCWDGWKKDFSVKVINELRLDLSSESGSAEYDRHLREYFGFEPDATVAAAPPE